MPQFELSTALSQVVWLAIVFALLFLILNAMLPSLQRVSDRRERLVADDLASAERLKAEAEETHAAYEASLSEARAEALKLVTEVKEAAARATAERVKLVDAELEGRMQEAAARVEEARRRASAELTAVAESAAADIVERLLGRRPDADRVRAAVAGAAKGSGGGASATA